MTTQTPNVTYYTVKKGDTLTAIAATYGTTVDQLVKWNKIPNRDLIKIGQRLVVAKSEPASAT